MCLPRPLYPGQGSWLTVHQGKTSQGGARGSPEGGAITSPQADAAGGGMLQPRKMVSSVWENDSAQGSWWLSLQLSPQSHKPQHSSCDFISLLFCQSPGRTAANEIFLHWPFKWVSMFLADSGLSLTDKSPTTFHSQMLCGCIFPALGLSAGEPGLGLSHLAWG